MRYWVTLCTNKSFLRGAEFLNASLQKVGSKYQLVAMITENVFYEPIYIPSNLNFIKVPYFKFKKGKPFHLDTINKFNLFNLEYEKICFIDADTLVLENIDYIFDLYNLDLTCLYYTRPCGKRKVNDISGSFFLVNRKIPIGDVKLLEDFYEDDEDVFVDLVKKYNLTTESFDPDVCDKIYHDVGPIKYWDLINLQPFAFINYYNSEQIKTLLKLIYVYKAKTCF